MGRMSQGNCNVENCQCLFRNYLGILFERRSTPATAFRPLQKLSMISQFSFLPLRCILESNFLSCSNILFLMFPVLVLYGFQYTLFRKIELAFK